MSVTWNLGFRNHASGKYLTQETFGFALNCNGNSLKKKQTFTLEVAPEGGVYIRTSLGKYIYGDNDGNVKGDADGPGPETLWTIVPQPDGTWALQTAPGFWFHGTGNNLTAFVKGDEPPADGKWVVHLAMHPQINLYSVQRKRYVHLNGDQLTTDEDIPWGEDALITLYFFSDHPDGRYGLIACNGKFLSRTGRLVDQPDETCQFLLGFNDNQISLMVDDKGAFLTASGSVGTLKAGTARGTFLPKKDELFEIQDSQPQFVMTTNQNKTVSVRTGVEVKADKFGDVSDNERFQMLVLGDGKVRMMTNKTTFWTTGDDGVISCATKQSEVSSACDYSIEYHGNRVKFVGNNGKYVTVRGNGALVASGDGSSPEELFTFTLINRPQLMLRGNYGFIDIKGASGRIECNKSNGGVFRVHNVDGAYQLQDPKSGKFWTHDDQGNICLGSQPDTFFFEFVSSTLTLIKHSETGKYLKGEQNGGFTCSGVAREANTEWEF